MFVEGGVSTAGYVKFSKKRLASAGHHCSRNPAGRIDRNPTHNYPPTSNYSSLEGLCVKSPLREGGKQRDRASSAPPRGEEVRPTALVIVRQFIYSYELSGNSQTLPKPGRIRDGAPGRESFIRKENPENRQVSAYRGQHLSPIRPRAAPPP